MMRVRKELIQSRSKIADLQDELEEKTSLYLNAIKVSTLFQVFRFQNSRPSIVRFPLVEAIIRCAIIMKGICFKFYI